MDKIYLQVEDSSGMFGETTWCENKINETDIEYIRADELATLRERVRELEKVLEYMADDDHWDITQEGLYFLMGLDKPWKEAQKALEGVQGE